VSYKILRHPRVEHDLRVIVRLIADYARFGAGPGIALAKLQEIEHAVRRLAETPHIGSLRDEISPGLRAIPAGRKAVIVFKIDDVARRVLIVCITYGGADWIGRSTDRDR
jgi:plasmid stabilization system protein ParE